MDIETTKVYKTSIIILIMLVSLLWILPYIDYFWLTEKELSVLGWNGYGSVIQISALAYWLLYAVVALTMLGLFFWINIARKVFIIFITGSIFTPALWGFSVATPLEASISFVVVLLYGVILVLSFVKPLNKNFKSLKKYGEPESNFFS